MMMFHFRMLLTLLVSACWVGPVVAVNDATFEQHISLRKLASSGDNNGVCIGSRLLSGERLYRNEFLCDASDSYRFGLDHNGYLADRYGPSLPSSVGDIIWAPADQSESGDYLHMQRDGNLVLYKYNDGDEDDTVVVVWSTQCFGDGAILIRSGSTFPNLYTVRPDRIPEASFAPDEDKIWRVHYDKSTSCTPAVYCRNDDQLLPGKRLKRDEYICPFGFTGELLTDSYRFGMDNRERLALMGGASDVIWSAAEGDYLTMQKDGNAVVRRNGKAVWASSCRQDGNILKLEEDGVVLRNVDGDARWFAGFDGVESETCDALYAPTDQCNTVGFPSSGGSCRIRMIDHLNVAYVELEAKDVGDGMFEITDNVLGSCGREPWTVEARLDGDDVIIDAGVPDVTCSEILDDYKVPLNDSQLDFRNVEGYPCTTFGMNLIWFMILQWFYFG